MSKEEFAEYLEVLIDRAFQVGVTTAYKDDELVQLRRDMVQETKNIIIAEFERGCDENGL